MLDSVPLSVAATQAILHSTGRGRRGLTQALCEPIQAIAMIRQFKSNDMNPVLDIWLSASMKAHDFVEPGFWETQLENMREIYIPSAEVYVYEEESKICAFYALFEDELAAIFVAPKMQGKGIGKSLILHAKTKRKNMTLSVYKSNVASVGFYRSQGFSIIEENVDEATGHEEYIMRVGT